MFLGILSVETFSVDACEFKRTQPVRNPLDFQSLPNYISLPPEDQLQV